MSVNQARSLLSKNEQHIPLTKFDMKRQKQFNLHNVLDPFTLLEVSQALREIQVGEFLEFTYPGEHIPDKLFKIIPDDQFEIVGRETGSNPTGCTLIIKRRKVAPVDSDCSAGGCDCS
ncbi:MAG: hypothetical protein JRC87_04690 [Deltaproteobacteria bacterium]|nr:hypothetical protein [Deltaproteobacteria bacterium]